MDDRYSPEFNKIFAECSERGYVKNNHERLRSFFERAENLTMLKHVLTTKRNFAAIRIIDRLKIKVIPMLYINQHTYESIFWLNKMGIVTDSDFLEMEKKFCGMKNSEIMFRDTRRNFISMQIENSRREHKHTRGCDRPADLPASLQRMELAFIGEATFFVDLDEFIDVQELLSGCSNIKRNSSKYDHVTDYYARHPSDSVENHPLLRIDRKISSFILTEDDSLRPEKQEGFRVAKSFFSSEKSYLHYERLSPAQKKSINRLIPIIHRLESADTSCLLVSRHPLGRILYVFLVYNINIRFLAVISISSEMDVSGLSKFHRSDRHALVFGRGGNMPPELLELTVDNYLRELKMMHVRNKL